MTGERGAFVAVKLRRGWEMCKAGVFVLLGRNKGARNYTNGTRYSSLIALDPVI